VGGLLLAVAIAIATSAVFGPPARAGTYTVQECFGSDFSAPDAVYLTNGSLAFTPTNDCGGVGVAIGTQGAGFSGPLHAAWAFYAPQGAFINTVNLERRSFAGGTYAPAVSVCSAAGNCNSYVVNTSGYEGTQFGPGGWAYLTVFIGCGVSPCNAGGYIYVRNLVFTIDDVTPPAVGPLGGSLVSAGTKRGNESLTVGASDPGGGVRRVAVKVNGAIIGERALGCALDGNGIGSRLRPCGGASESFSVSTEAPPWVQGANTLEVCAFDYATGNSPNQGCRSQTIVVDNSCPTSAGAAQASSIDAGLQKQGPTGSVAPSVAVRSTQGATVRGDLDDASGAPVAGANVCLYETIDAEGEIRQLAQVTKTKTDGSFAVQVEPGPSRRFELGYRYSNQVVEKGSLYLDSAVRPSFRLRSKGKLHNGQNVGFRGAIPGPNAAGRGISVQARVGKKWRTFKQIKVNAKGRFKGRYRFTSTRGLVIYRFRARVKRQGNYPYSPGSSKVLKVRVRG